MKKLIKWLLTIFITLALLIFIAIIIVPKMTPSFGAPAKGKYLERIKSSVNYKEGSFTNLLPTPMNTSGDSFFNTFLKFIRGGEDRKPKNVIQTSPFDKAHYSSADTSLSVTWFGHSTVLLKTGGKTLLIDPVFSDHASPFPFMGPRSFPYSQEYAIEDLPDIDAVLISHDHYDHLDYETIRKLNEKVSKFFVPLGLAAHLMRWNVPEANIYEMDWWDEVTFDNLLFACVPMRHFSGRAITDRNSTLWAGWVIQSENRTVIHTGDSGYGPHFKKIGEKYGPFDLTMVECGQYNESWKLIHMMPEETVQAHLDMQGKFLIPIHWGRFNLALHPWKDPVLRVSAAAIENNVALITPVVGKTFTLNPPPQKSEWWRNIN